MTPLDWHGRKASTQTNNILFTGIFAEKNISIYATFNDQSFNDTLINDIFSFE